MHTQHVTVHTLIVGVSVQAVNNGAVDCEGTDMTQTVQCVYVCSWSIHSCTPKDTHTHTQIKTAWSLTFMTFPPSPPLICLCVCPTQTPFSSTNPPSFPSLVHPNIPLFSLLPSIVSAGNGGMSSWWRKDADAENCLSYGKNNGLLIYQHSSKKREQNPFGRKLPASIPFSFFPF